MRLALVTTLIALGAACSGGETPAPAPAPAPETVEAPAPPPEPPIPPAQLALFTPIKAGTVAPTDKGLVDLGRTLYYDTRLSADRDLSCNSCHLLDKYGVDGTPTSTGHKGQKGGRNAPTVYNAFGHIAQFWDGRAANLVDQAKGPVLNPIEMHLPTRPSSTCWSPSPATSRRSPARSRPSPSRSPTTTSPAPSPRSRSTSPRRRASTST